MKIARLYIALLIFCLPGLKSFAGIGTQNLRCEMLENPTGIGSIWPRLSWQITGEGRNINQTAYRIIVASTPAKLAANLGDLWDSQKVSSDQSIMVKYAGKLVASRSACYWKVKVYTNKGESAWSSSAYWTVGLLNAADWKARWIGYENGFPWDSVSKFSRLSARYYRKQFDAAKGIKKATVYIVGLGHYELYINGKAVSDQVLAQAPTDYTESVKYNTFDVTGSVRSGTNVIATVLGNGRFFTMRPKYKPKKIKEFGFPKMLLQLELEYTDGTRNTILSDESWKFTADGPIRTNNEYDGEEYDATKEMPGWNTVGFDDSKWLKPELVSPPGGKLVPQVNEPIKIMNTIKPISIKSAKNGAWILDMGQNMAGWLQMKVRGKAGEKVTMRFAETLALGELYLDNLRDAKVTDTYTLKGGGEETWHPVFVFHGFRYVELSGYPGTPALNDFEGQVVYDAIATTGQFETSNPLINQVYQNAWWGVLGNYKGMPVDCPQRNERMPWLGDRAVGSLGESFMFANGNLYAKWLDDIQESQKPDGAIPDVAPAYWNYYSDNMTWPGTYILIADMLHRQFGDQAPIEKHYVSMKKWMDYMRSKYLKNDIMTKDKYGDWCVPPESPELIHSKDSARNTDGQLIATAYYYHLSGLMQGFARLLHKPADVKAYADIQAKTAAAFNKKYFDQARGRYANNTVTANLLPLYFGITPVNQRPAVFRSIARKIENDDKGHISTGVIGTQWLMRGLTAYGRPDLAYRIAGNDDYPSWGYMAKHGATTIWELWNGDTANPAMNSHNHIMLLGDLITWFYEDLAGIKTIGNGFKKIEMNPSPVKGLDHVKSAYQTPYGEVKSSWTNIDGHFNWQITIPPNSKAMVYVPFNNMNAVTEGGQKVASRSAVKFIRAEGSRCIFEIGSGSYAFEVNK